MSDGGLLLSVAYDLTCFITFLVMGLYKLSRVPSIRSRRVVSNGGPRLSVACL